MAEPEVEAAWRAEFKRIHATEAPDSVPDDPKAAFRWSGDEAETQRLQEEHTHHYLRWTFVGCHDCRRYRRGPIVFTLKRPDPAPAFLDMLPIWRLGYERLAVLQLSKCKALYHVVKVAPGWRTIVEDKLSCRLCGDPLPGRDEIAVLKYFLLPRTAVTRTKDR